ncbi:hypothetical protein FSARC_12920 [Fusarium sarcochroum]|uniref:chitinase n=1 Tax=Fusarium sarcochroum TaxID=1208366 RepID=A0A8H4WV13_9HYPO|nr:hypothetical protein FSARC_12920 [Fusarium sarcochroum]
MVLAAIKLAFVALAQTVCVGNCIAKSECDPGFGIQWANATECPLNGCCSDAGYCGIGQEFCGDRKFDKRSCDSKVYPVGRVIGYYDATQQSCDLFSPSNIRADIYTHINFAYATIDTETFRIRPQFKDDIDIYHELVRLKELKRSLKIFISVGGWQFGEGPRQQTMSEMVASEEKQTVFISSLISFINTYEFDGLDFDWRYPGAPQKNGDIDDVKNLVTFARNLKAALRSTGRGDAFSMTLPASYSYLQYFDLKSLSQHVDWFNFMSFDLHGAFRTPDSWINNKLNAHTNLTEIADAVDLLWRSGVPSSNVNLGLAFYSRTLTASSSDCIHKGCPFDSAGQSWGCSGELGLLSNADINLMVSSSNTKPGLDEKAAVRTMRRDDQWIAYDDQTTIQIKVDFARSQCMGGVFVCLTKQDFDGVDLGDYTVESCRWSNCAGDYPSGYEAIKRVEDGEKG